MDPVNQTLHSFSLLFFCFTSQPSYCINCCLPANRMYDPLHSKCINRKLGSLKHQIWKRYLQIATKHPPGPASCAHHLPPALGPCNAGTALHSPSRPPGPAASDGPQEHFFFSSSCCVRSMERRIIASSRSCPVHATESKINPTALTAAPQCWGESPNGALYSASKPPRHTCSPTSHSSQWVENKQCGWCSSQPQHLIPGRGCCSQASICLRITPDKH